MVRTFLSQLAFIASDYLDSIRWKPFDPARNWPDLGPRFSEGERIARRLLRASSAAKQRYAQGIRYADGAPAGDDDDDEETVEDDRRDLDWATVLKRIFESYVRGERPNMYGEMLRW